MDVISIENFFIKQQFDKVSSEVIQVDGILRDLIKSEAKIRSFSKDWSKAQCIQTVNGVLPGLVDLIPNFGTSKSIGKDLEKIRVKFQDEIDETVDSYLKGLILEAYIKHNVLEDAKKVVLDTKSLTNHGLRWSYFAAKTFLALDNLDEALKTTNEFLTKFPVASAAFLHLRGLIYRQMGQLELASDDFLSALELDASYKAPVYPLYFIIQKKIGVDRCIQVVQKALDEEPNTPEYTRTLADAYTAKGRIDLATPLFLESTKKIIIEKKPRLGKLDWPDELIKKPDFIIIGTPKSGTTSAYAYMCRHPKILTASVKEISFFASNQKYKYGIDWYLSHFPSLAGTKDFITGEASPGYFYSDIARERIKAHFPESKLILFLRDPSARAISGYYQRKKMNGKLPDIETYFDDQFRKAENIAPEEFIQTDGVLSGGLYLPRLEQWFSSFGEDSLLIIKAEDLFSNPSEVMNRIYKHVGVEKAEHMKFPVVNKGLYPEAPEALVERLKKFYQPHNEKLYNRLGQKFTW